MYKKKIDFDFNKFGQPIGSSSIASSPQQIKLLYDNQFEGNYNSMTAIKITIKPIIFISHSSCFMT